MPEQLHMSLPLLALLAWPLISGSALEYAVSLQSWLLSKLRLSEDYFLVAKAADAQLGHVHERLGDSNTQRDVMM
jgi:hypothetical protein